MKKQILNNQQNMKSDLGTFFGLIAIYGLVVVLENACVVMGEKGEISRTASETQTLLEENVTPLLSLSMDLEKAKALHFNQGNVQKASHIYKKLVHDEGLSLDQRVEAAVLLSEALEKLGDKEAAIQVIEDFLIEHYTGSPYTDHNLPLRQRLEQILLGRKWKSNPVQDPNAANSVTMMRIVTQLPCDTKLNVRSFYRRSDGNIFYQHLRKTYDNYCLMQEHYQSIEQKREIHFKRSISQFGSNWVSIPQESNQFENALVIFTHTSDVHPIPERYVSKYFSIEYNELQKNLSKGFGVVAFDFNHKLPRVLVAVPMQYQLEKLVNAFMNAKGWEIDKDNVFTLKLDIKWGSLPREVIQKVISNSIDDVRQCYETALNRHNPDFEGKILLKWIISPQGTVTDVHQDTHIPDALEDDYVNQCIVDIIQSLKFPSPAGGGVVEVNYPFSFKSVHSLNTVTSNEKKK